MRIILAALAFLAAPAMAQTPQTAPDSPGKSAFTPAPVPEITPGVPSTTNPSVVPEQIAPPADTAGPSAATPFSNAPSGLGDNVPGKSTPSLSR